MQQQISKMAADINQHFDRRFKRALSVPPRGQVQSLRAFRRPKLSELELPGFQDFYRLACRGAAEDILSESWESLNECLPHPESSEKHCGADKEKLWQTASE